MANFLLHGAKPIKSYPSVTILFNRRSTATLTKKGAVEIELRHNGRRWRLSTGVSVTKDQWDPEKGVINHPKAFQLNREIQTFYKSVEDYIMRLRLDCQDFSYQRMRITLGLVWGSNENSFIDYVEFRIRERNDIRESTRRQHLKLPKILREYGGIKRFEDLTRVCILDFDEWLRGRGYLQTTVHCYHKWMKVYINDAIARDLLVKNPYAGIKINRGKPSKHKFLTEYELWLLENCENLPPTLMRVRDLFVFQCYTGLAYAELASFDFSNVTQHGDQFIMTGRRQKTGEDFYLVLIEPAMDILDRYDYKLPLMSNAQYNLRLKAVASAAGIDKPLTSHAARHTAACMFLNNGMSIEIVAKILGHTDIKTTQQYAKIFNNTIDRAFQDFGTRIQIKKEELKY